MYSTILSKKISAFGTSKYIRSQWCISKKTTNKLLTLLVSKLSYNEKGI